MPPAALCSWGKELRWAWPRDGRRETLEGAGIALAEQYKEQGLNMLHEHAQFEDGSVSVEAGLMAMLTRMQTGKFKVFKHLSDWWEEFRLYHRKDGKVVKEGDDLMAATRYAIMRPSRWRINFLGAEAAWAGCEIDFPNLAGFAVPIGVETCFIAQTYRLCRAASNLAKCCQARNRRILSRSREQPSY